MRNSFLLLALVFLPSVAFAQVVITEVMYDPAGADTGHEWIEVYNTTQTPVKLTDLKLFENGTNHKIVAQGSDMLAPSSYAVVASNPTDFKSDWPQFNGVLFKSAFNLSNSGETIALRTTSSTDVDTVSYSSSLGGAGDGNSLNRAPGDTSFVARAPSPGSPMSSAAIPPPAPKQAPVPKTKTTPTRKSTSLSANSPYTPNVVAAPEAEQTTVPEVRAENAAAAAPVSSSNTSYLWWIAAAGLALLAAASIVVAKRFGKSEWDIVEDTSK